MRCNKFTCLHKKAIRRGNKEKRKLEKYRKQTQSLEYGKNKKPLEEDVENLWKKDIYTFKSMLKDWMESSLQQRHPEMTLILNLALLIPPPTAEVERSFSLMKLVCSQLQARLTPENVSHFMRISKFWPVTEKDHKDILKPWLAADDTKSGKRKVAC